MQSPHMSHIARGALFLAAGITLFLYVTNIITTSLSVIILLSSLLLMIYGFIEIGGYKKLIMLLNGKK